MNIIIAGGGTVGASLAKQLSAEGHDITLIDSDDIVLEASVERYDVMSVRDCTAPSQNRYCGSSYSRYQP